MFEVELYKPKFALTLTPNFNGKWMTTLREKSAGRFVFDHLPNGAFE